MLQEIRVSLDDVRLLFDRDYGMNLSTYLGAEAKFIQAYLDTHINKLCFIFEVSVERHGGAPQWFDVSYNRPRSRGRSGTLTAPYNPPSQPTSLPTPEVQLRARQLDDMIGQYRTGIVPPFDGVNELSNRLIREEMARREMSYRQMASEPTVTWTTANTSLSSFEPPL